MISLDEYMRTSYRPDCDFIEAMPRATSPPGLEMAFSRYSASECVWHQPCPSCRLGRLRERVTAEAWATATDGVMRTADGRVAMPLADVLLP